MKLKLFLLPVLFIFIFSLTATAQNKEHKFIGSEQCKKCHNSAKKGEQFKIWNQTDHAKAYAKLASEEGLKKAKELGVENPQKSDKCLSCHTTAFGKDNLWTKTYTLEEGVGCESCHGAGDDYKSMKVMKSRDESVANGMKIPDEKTCMNCHKADNPGHKGKFVYKESWEKIKHANPEAKK